MCVHLYASAGYENARFAFLNGVSMPASPGALLRPCLSATSVRWRSATPLEARQCWYHPLYFQTAAPPVARREEPEGETRRVLSVNSQLVEKLEKLRDHMSFVSGALK